MEARDLRLAGQRREEGILFRDDFESGALDKSLWWEWALDSQDCS